MKSMTACRTLFGLIGLTSTQLAFAHGGHGESGLADGLGHSLAGPEHALALIAFGAWAVLVFHGTVWRLLGGTLCAIALGAVIGWLAPGGPMPDSIAVAWLLSTGLLIALRDRIKPSASTAGLFALAAAQGYTDAAVGHSIAEPVAFALGTMLPSALLMFIGASLGGALRVDRAVHAGGTVFRVLRGSVANRITG